MSLMQSAVILFFVFFTMCIYYTFLYLTSTVNQNIKTNDFSELPVIIKVYLQNAFKLTYIKNNWKPKFNRLFNKKNSG